MSGQGVLTFTDKQVLQIATAIQLLHYENEKDYTLRYNYILDNLKSIYFIDNYIYFESDRYKIKYDFLKLKAIETWQYKK